MKANKVDEDKTTTVKDHQLKISTSFGPVFKSGLILLAVGCWFLLNWLGNSSSDNNNMVLYQIIKWFLLYIVLLMLLSFFSRFKYVRYLQSILLMPWAILNSLGPIIHSAGAIFMVFALSFCLTAVLFIVAPEKLLGWTIEHSAGIFVALTMTSIIVTTFGDRLVSFYHDIQDKDDMKLYKEHSLKLLDQSKTRWLIFTLYFVLLIIFNFTSLNKTPLFSTDNFEIAILQSFATYVAFDRLFANWNIFKREKK
jgi:hypothetical protein